MKALYTFRPSGSGDAVTITQSSYTTGFPGTNLKVVDPVKSWKSNVGTPSEWVKYDFGAGGITIDSVFLNRFNFTDFNIQLNNSDVWTSPTIDIHVTDAVKDDVQDENFMHYFKSITSGTYRYLRILINSSAPSFGESVWKIGNLFVGVAVELWNPKTGFQIAISPKLNEVEFDSGYGSSYKLGRSKHLMSGSTDKITITEWKKFLNTYNPFVIWFDFTGDSNVAFLVKATREYARSYDLADVVSSTFQLQEIV